MTDTRIACVKWFNPKSGYGFITDIDSTDDIFVHHSELQTSENVYRSLTTGEYVQFETKIDDKGKSTAINVTGVGGGLLLCETTAINIAERRERNASRDGGNSRHRLPSKEEP
jgi:cold shock protein